MHLADNYALFINVVINSYSGFVRAGKGNAATKNRSRIMESGDGLAAKISQLSFVEWSV